jgi:serine/threonine-protein kinase
MNFISAFKAERLIAQIRGEADVSSSSARKAFEKLHQVGPAAVPKILLELGTADRRQTTEFIEILGKLADDKSLPSILQGLADTNPKTVAGTTAALSSSRRFNPNRLVDLLAEDNYSKSAVVDILLAHKDRLSINHLLAQVYDLQPSEKTAVFKMVHDLASIDQVPDLLARMNGKDPVVKMNLIKVISQFERDDVQQALQEQLRDENKMVRQAALTGLSRLNGAVNVELICSLLLDPDVDVIDKTIDVIVNLKHPETIKYLIPALKDESEFSRRAAVEVLNAIGSTDDIKHLLEAIADDDWWVRARASDALARIGGERVVNAVLELIKDKDEDVRRSAIEILNTCRDPRAVDNLIEATADDDWWVSERAADALAEIGDAKAVPALVKMLERQNKSAPTALRAIGKLGNRQVLKKLLPFVKSEDMEIKSAAIEAVANVTDAKHSEAVGEYIRKHASGQGDAVAKIAAKALQKLEGAGKIEADELKPSSSSAEEDLSKSLMTSTAKTEHPTAAEPSTTASVSLDLSALRTGEMIEGRYKFIQKIGKGAFGTVVLVHDTVVDDQLILKFLNPNVSSDEEMMKRFVHELRYSRKITHKNVIRIYDFLAIGGGYAISMEYFPSHTLGKEISDDKRMDAKTAVSYACDICTGMQIAHFQGIIHRDLKPANILINDEGLLKIVDFGVAAAATSGDTQLTKTGYVIGSPKYMAPEQILGKKVDIRADVYSVGIILYEMLAGKPPYSRGDHMSVMYQHVQGKATALDELNDEVSKELSNIVTKAMSVDKNDRYSSMDQLKAALEQAATKLS